MKRCAFVSKRLQLVFRDSLVQLFDLQPQALDFLCWLTGILGCMVGALRINCLMNQRLSSLDNSRQGLLHATAPAT